jgi:hypothetical protein
MSIRNTQSPDYVNIEKYTDDLQWGVYLSLFKENFRIENL